MPFGLGGRLAYGLLVRAVAACCLISFASLLPQLPGLVGPHGVQPAQQALGAIDAAAAAAKMPRWAKWARFPTLLWLLPDCRAEDLRLVAGVGAGASLVALLGCAWGSRLPLVVAAACWVSLIHVGGEFLAYPWDWMLVECVFLAALLPQPRLFRLRLQEPVPPVVALALRFLAFRLMFGMGLKKFYDTKSCDKADGCAWPDGRYLRTFYIWQPMVTPGGWLAHHGGKSFHAASTWTVWLSQMVFPFGMFGPSWLRALIAIVNVMEQIWIQFTGNFGIFNLLSAAVLSLPLLAVDSDGDSCSQRLRRPWRQSLGVWLLEAVALANMALGSFYLLRPLLVGNSAFSWLSNPEWLFQPSALGAFRQPLGDAFPRLEPLLGAVLETLRLVAPFRICNPYGIFRTSPAFPPGLKGVRKFEGKSGKRWQPYVWPTSRFQATGGFADVPGLPPWFAPHQPRADHSVFYIGMEICIGSAAFDNYYTQALADNDATPWLIQRALVEGHPDVLALLVQVPEGPVSRVRSFVADCRVRKPGVSVPAASPLELAREMWGAADGSNRSASIWKRCDRAEADLADLREGSLKQLVAREAKERKRAQGIFNKVLRREWATASPGRRALAVPAAALAASALVQLWRRRSCCRCRGRRTQAGESGGAGAKAKEE